MSHKFYKAKFINIIKAKHLYKNNRTSIVLFGGTTILHKAAACGLIEIAESLIKHNEYVSAPDSFGRTPLHNAAICGNSVSYASYCYLLYI